VIVALPVFLVEHTGVGDEGKTVIIEFGGEAHTVGSSTTVDGTSTDAHTTSPVTVASGGARGPFRPYRDVAVNTRVGSGNLRASAKGSASHEVTIVVDIPEIKISGDAVSALDILTSPGENFRIVQTVARGDVVAPKISDRPVVGIEVKDLLDVKGALERAEVRSRVVNAISKATTVLFVSTEVALGQDIVQSDIVKTEAVDILNARVLRVAVEEAVEVLDNRKMANTTT